MDATIGGGGHAIEILKKGGRIIGLDVDSDACEYTGKRLANLACPLNAFRIFQANFVDLNKILEKTGVNHPAGILFDLGTSFHQLEARERGFSFMRNSPLDMRMDKNLAVSAAQLVAGLSQKELYELFTKLGEEKYSRAITRDIVRTRLTSPIKTTKQLAEIAARVYQKYKVESNIDPATKIFQALRIVVNDELNSLKQALPQAVDCLRQGGRLVVISFQGLEDKIVKEFFQAKEKESILEVLTKKPIQPSLVELTRNPRSRSARLRAAQKR